MKDDIAQYLPAYKAFVIVNWGDRYTPTLFYNRIKQINSTSAGTCQKVFPVVACVYMCSTNDIARLLSNFADDLGASFVLIIQGTGEEFVLNDDDIERALEFKNGLHKAGRPPKKEKK